MKSLVAFVDGGSRGNPGTAGYGAHIVDEEGKVLAGLSGPLGVRSNNYAEYAGLIAALDYALSNRFEKVTVFADSELMVRQIRGVYKVRSPNLRRSFQQARALIGQLKAFSIRHIPRARNREADRLANLAMDSQALARRGLKPTSNEGRKDIHEGGPKDLSTKGHEGRRRATKGLKRLERGP